MTGRFKVECDLYDISSRLKEIDERYELYRNRRKGRFEIYVDRELQIAVPYPVLDGRTIELVRKTRIENRRRLIEEIERHNARLEKEGLNKAVDNAFAAADL